ncbi:hypothetical protein [Lolliginicoccus suaedae]|nr:hypothetical protein [Lolliginicoccus suaedae]
MSQSAEEKVEKIADDGDETSNKTHDGVLSFGFREASPEGQG